MNPTTAHVGDLTDDQLADMSTRVDRLLRAGLLYDTERPSYVLTRARLAAEIARRRAISVGDRVTVAGSRGTVAEIVERQPGDLFVVRHAMGRELVHRSLLTREA